MSGSDLYSLIIFISVLLMSTGILFFLFRQKLNKKVVHYHLLLLIISLFCELYLIVVGIVNKISELDNPNVILTMKNGEYFYREIGHRHGDMDFVYLGFILPVIGISVVSSLVAVIVMVVKKYHKKELKKEFWSYIILLSLMILLPVMSYVFLKLYQSLS